MTNTIEIRNYIDITLLKHNVLTESKGFPMEENHINRLIHRLLQNCRFEFISQCTF